MADNFESEYWKSLDRLLAENPERFFYLLGGGELTHSEGVSFSILKELGLVAE